MKTDSADAPLSTFRIAPARGWTQLRLAEVWEFRELLYFLVWRDIKVRYKQTALGIAWAVIQPLGTMLIFYFSFGKLAKIPSDGLPYPLFCYAALVPWSFFAAGLTQSSNSLVGNSNLITKVYFPRLIIPLATVLSGIVDFLLAFALLVGMMAWYGIAPSVYAPWLPAFLLLTLLISLGVGLWLSALNVEYRDVRYVVPFLAQFWMLATPIAYPSSLLRAPLRTIFGLNPMTGVIEGFRWALLGTQRPPISMLLVSAVVALLVLLGGAFYFRRMEKTFADIV